jgi:hypothetical protein
VESEETAVRKTEEPKKIAGMVGIALVSRCLSQPHIPAF